MLKSFSNYKKALLIGIGGGADIIGTIPTKLFLESYGIKCILGGLPWERYSIDPFPGPRPFSQIINNDIINDSLCWAKQDTKTLDGLFFSESKASKVLKEKILLVNIFNSRGKLIKKVKMGDYKSNFNFYYRMSKGFYHMPVAMTKYCVYHEIFSGPFLKKKENIENFLDGDKIIRYY